GSFTGATSDHPGLFQAAKGGTLFLDEIADLPLSMQAKLLRAIQERAVRPVGGHEEIAIDCRILSATHQDLKSLVDNGKFREDLFYRINVIDLDVPPLRSRVEDIDPLIKHMLQQIAERNSIATPEIEPGLVEVLSSYSFPGNIRELENILERAVALGAEKIITVIDLNLPTSSDKPVATICKPAESESLDHFLQRIEKELILKALEESGNNKTRAAESLGISFRSFRYKIKKLCLSGDE
ncbi:MAG: sigma 54-interacting transcriptional regulator, partial [Nitrosomonadaceae bacterium]